jgi:D-sedoheptulose 7-phosphate isomerase
MEYIEEYLKGAGAVIDRLDRAAIREMVQELARLREEEGRLFFLGVGGGAGICSHAVNDFRKIARIEAYTPVDNVSELSARVNDDGWETVFAEWLKVSKLNSRDGVFVFSVGGGNLEKKISVNIVESLKYARQVGAKIVGVVGRDGGYTARMADACVVVPVVNDRLVTPYTEAFQSVILHLIVSHPELKEKEMKWEAVNSKR